MGTRPNQQDHGRTNAGYKQEKTQPKPYLLKRINRYSQFIHYDTKI